MKKVVSIAMCMVLAAVPVQAWAGETETEARTFSFEQVAGQVFYFSSGVGGWAAELRMDKDGSFTGNYHDSEMGMFEDDYPNGTVYECAYHGQFTVEEPTGDKSWKLKVESLETDNGQEEDYIEDGIRHLTTEPAGLAEGDLVDLYCPGYPVADLSEDFIFWAHLNFYDPQPEKLPFYGIYNEARESGFVGPDLTTTEVSNASSEETEMMAGMANPWVETDAAGFAKKLGIELNVPEGAKDVTYAVMDDGSIGEMNFTWGNARCCARVSASGFWKDISGLYYNTWDQDEECKVKHCEGVIRGVKDKANNLVIRNCMWFDVVPGIMYSVTAEANDLDGFDIQAIAEMVYIPMQQDA